MYTWLSYMGHWAVDWSAAVAQAMRFVALCVQGCAHSWALEEGKAWGKERTGSRSLAMKPFTCRRRCTSSAMTCATAGHSFRLALAESRKF